MTISDCGLRTADLRPQRPVGDSVSIRNPQSAFRNPPAVVGLLLALGALAFAQNLEPGTWNVELDAVRSAWKFRRSVTVASPGTSEFAALVLSPELMAGARPGLADVRLVDAAGREVPYAVDRRADRRRDAVREGTLADTRIRPKESTEWIVDLGASAAFDTIELRIPGDGFAKRIRIETSADRESWRTLRADAGVFERPWAGGRVRHTDIPLEEPVEARYLRLTADDRKSSSVSLVGIRTTLRRAVPGESWSLTAKAADAPAGGGRSLYRLDLPPGLPVERNELQADDPAFARRVLLLEQGAGGAGRAVLGEGRLYRIRLDDAELSGESRSFAVRPPATGGALFLEIENGDSPPLRRVRVTASGPAVRLLFPAPDGPLALYSGNASVRAPAYDLEDLREALSLGSGYAAAEAGRAVENPKFRIPPPLAFAAPAGAPLGAEAWRMSRRLELPGAEDIYAVTLTAEDLRALRGDFGDLRVVDGQERQIPYVLETDAADLACPLGIEPDAKGSGAKAGTSRYRLTLPAVPEGSEGAAGDVSVRGLRLDAAEPFFSRPARVIDPKQVDPRAGPRVLYAGTLARSPGGRGGPIYLPFAARVGGELILEIDEGDNAPLTLKEASLLARAPRIVFKWKAAGEAACRMLLGNPSATAPQYDLATLRGEVLSYEAMPAKPGPLEPNPDYRRKLGDVFRGAPPALWLWGALGLSVLILLALTVRLLRTPGGGDSGPAAHDVRPG